MNVTAKAKTEQHPTTSTATRRLLQAKLQSGPTAARPVDDVCNDAATAPTGFELHDIHVRRSARKPAAVRACHISAAPQRRLPVRQDEAAHVGDASVYHRRSAERLPKSDASHP